MKQILQSFKNGKTHIVNAPAPMLKKNHVLIRTTLSLVSSGTERMLINFGRSSIIGKIKQQPEKVKDVINKIKTDGIASTLEAVKSKLDLPITMGYSNVGVVIAVGENVSHVAIGDRVVSNGAHAEIVCVPKNLCAKIPDNVSDEQASFTVLAAIALQSIRLSKPEIGECFGIIGLGIVGLLAAQILKANGCNVICFDIDKNKVQLAKRINLNAIHVTDDTDFSAKAFFLSNTQGLDGVIISASTQSNLPIKQAATLCRKKGRIVLVGVTGLEIDRNDFYQKELSFQVSCSYGPGRYDKSYEERGNDYPLPYVRWTENRNFQAILDLMSKNQIQTNALVSHHFNIEDAVKAYDLLTSNKPSMGIVLLYTEDQTSQQAIVKLPKCNIIKNERITVGVIGAGNYAYRTLVPILSKMPVRLKTITSNSSHSGYFVGKKFGFEYASTNPDEILHDSEINTVFILTRHDTHASFVIQALNARKHVFVEKPLCLTEDEEMLIHETHKQYPALRLVTGYNRRSAPHTQKIKNLLSKLNEPKCINITVNAGYAPADHWIHDPKIGGGRIVGEACHFLDLMTYLTEAEIINKNITYIDGDIETKSDKAIITLKFSDGSIGSIQYFANGHASFSKERIEIFCAGKILQLENFKVLRGFGWKNFKKMALFRQDKGHYNYIKEFITSISQ